MSFYHLPRERHTSPSWSDIKVEILHATTAEALRQRLNLALTQENIHALAFTAATVFCEEAFDTWTSTLVYQGRVDPLNGGQS